MVVLGLENLEKSGRNFLGREKLEKSRTFTESYSPNILMILFYMIPICCTGLQTHMLGVPSEFLDKFGVKQTFYIIT